MKTSKLLGSLIIAIMAPHLLLAGAGTTGAVLLKESVGSRSLAMGDAYAGLSNGPDSIYLNPAGLAAVETPELGAMYFKEIADMNLTAIQYAQPLNQLGSLGIGIESFSAGTMEVNYLNGDSKSVNAQTDYIINAAYGVHLKGGLSAGADLKYLNSKLAEAESANAVALDLGGLYNLPQMKEVTLGLALQNMGGGIKYIDEKDPLPFTVRVGAAYQTQLQNNIFTISGDLNKPKELSARFNLGAECLYNQVIALRAGYKFGYDVDSFTAGFGVKINRYRLDYAFAPKGDLGDTHRLSLGITF